MDFREMAEKLYCKLVDRETAASDMDPTYYIQDALRAAYSQGVEDGKKLQIMHEEVLFLGNPPPSEK